MRDGERGVMTAANRKEPSPEQARSKPGATGTRTAADAGRVLLESKEPTPVRIRAPATIHLAIPTTLPAPTDERMHADIGWVGVLLAHGGHTAEHARVSTVIRRIHP